VPIDVTALVIPDGLEEAVREKRQMDILRQWYKDIDKPSCETQRLTDLRRTGQLTAREYIDRMEPFEAALLSSTESALAALRAL